MLIDPFTSRTSACRILPTRRMPNLSRSCLGVRQSRISISQLLHEAPPKWKTQSDFLKQKFLKPTIKYLITKCNQNNGNNRKQVHPYHKEADSLLDLDPRICVSYQCKK